MKKVKILCMIAIFMFATITLLGCNSFDKYDWNEAYKIVYGIDSYGGEAYEEDYCLVSEDLYNQYTEKYSDSELSWNAKLKQMYVKFEGDTCYVKLISWGNYEEIITYKRSEISWVDYI